MSSRKDIKRAMEFKGYVGSIEADLEADILHGTVYGINDVIHYEARTPHELVQAFQDSVEDYLEMCEASGEPPEKPCSGKFQARVGEELHRLAAATAAAESISLNELLCRALARETSYRLDRDPSGESGAARQSEAATA